MTRPAQIAFWLCLLLAWIAASGCGSRDGNSVPTASISSGDDAASGASDSRKPPQDSLHPRAIIHTSLGDIALKLDAEHAPISVENFLNYVEKGHYDSTIFHQIQTKPAVILGGGFDTFQKEKPAEQPIRNEAHNGLKNIRGTIGMARRPNVIDSSTSQFYINVADNPQLDHRANQTPADLLDARRTDKQSRQTDRKTDEPASYGYCVFGEVTDGMDIVDRISHVPVRDVSDDLHGVPVDQVVVKWIHVVR